jgi:hypothetical protein
MFSTPFSFPSSHFLFFVFLHFCFSFLASSFVAIIAFLCPSFSVNPSLYVFYHEDLMSKTIQNYVSTKNFKKNYVFINNTSLHFLCHEDSMSKVIPRKILSLPQAPNLYHMFNCKVPP